jgi:hypothetical protein
MINSKNLKEKKIFKRLFRREGKYVLASQHVVKTG